jgi:hypothetical protein
LLASESVRAQLGRKGQRQPSAAHRASADLPWSFPVQGSIARSAYNALMFRMAHRCWSVEQQQWEAVPATALFATLGCPIYPRHP